MAPATPGPRLRDFSGANRTAIPHHKVGTHRRVYLKDLLEYQRQRDASRRATLDDLRSKVEAAGLYEKGTAGNDER